MLSIIYVVSPDSVLTADWSFTKRGNTHLIRGPVYSWRVRLVEPAVLHHWALAHRTWNPGCQSGA